MRSREDSQSEKLRGKNRHFFSERFGRDPFGPRGGGVSFLVVKPDGLWKSPNGAAMQLEPIEVACS
jgi:hypothetical protein